MAGIGYAHDDPGQWIPLEVLARDAEVIRFERLLQVPRIRPTGSGGASDPPESPPPPLS